ncbi:MAG: GNAT family N-acetyltransferase [Sedimentisphaerales bacterium]|nr:GNAT family N-acetyltransferase [Sedimentisphaerales bacterium]
MTIETYRLLLREFEPRDAGALHPVFSDALATRFTLRIHREVAETLAWIEAIRRLYDKRGYGPCGRNGRDSPLRRIGCNRRLRRGNHGILSFDGISKGIWQHRLGAGMDIETGKAMDVELIQTKLSQAEVIANLVPYYIYDLSEQMGWRCPESGQFGGEDDLPQYWGKPTDDPQYTWGEGTEGYPFIIRAEGELGGFALVKKFGGTARPHFEIGAFFVLRKFRRRHVGEHIAKRLFSMFRGEWTVGSMAGNTPANRFWAAVISDYSRNQFQTTTGKDESGRFDMIFHHFCSYPESNMQ